MSFWWNAVFASKSLHWSLDVVQFYNFLSHRTSIYSKNTKIDLTVLRSEKSQLTLGFCMHLLGKTSIFLPFPVISLCKLYRRLSYSSYLLSFNQCLITCRSFWCRQNHNQYGPRRLPVSTRYSFLHARWRQHENRAQSKLKFHSRGPRGEYPPCQRSRQAVCRLRHDLSHSFYQPLCAGKILELFTFTFTPIFHLACEIYSVTRNFLSKNVKPRLTQWKTSCSSRVIKKNEAALHKSAIH